MEIFFLLTDYPIARITVLTNEKFFQPHIQSEAFHNRPAPRPTNASPLSHQRKKTQEGVYVMETKKKAKVESTQSLVSYSSKALTVRQKCGPSVTELLSAPAWDRLPLDVIVHWIDLCDGMTLARLQRVCRTFATCVVVYLGRGERLTRCFKAELYRTLQLPATRRHDS
jgi:hypothetical protein